MRKNKINYLDSRNPNALTLSPTIFYKCENNVDWSTYYISNGCENIMEVDATYLISHKSFFSKMIRQSEREVIWETVQNALAGRMPFHLLYHICTPENNQKLLCEQGQGIYDDKGNIIELNGFITDLTYSQTKTPYNYSILDYKECTKQVIHAAYQKHLVCTHKINISQREIEIAIYICQGFTMKEIGLQLELLARTVESYLYHIKRKLCCHTKQQLKELIMSTDAGKSLVLTYLANI